MNLDHETVEILMGKHLDGEISSAETRLLQAHLDQDPGARQRLDQLQDLHRTSREVVTEAVLGRGRSAQDIIDAALHQEQSPHHLQWLRRCVFSQFAAGLAAGLLIATVGARLLTPPPRQEAPVRVAGQSVDKGPARASGLEPAWVKGMQTGPSIQRNVDWIVFPDEQGKYWLIEGLREDTRMTPAAYKGEL